VKVESNSIRDPTKGSVTAPNVSRLRILGSGGRSAIHLAAEVPQGAATLLAGTDSLL